MADLTINDIPEGLAPDEHRKPEGEAFPPLSEGLRNTPSPTGGTKLERARAFVARQHGKPLTPELIEEAINTGRP
ncbi:MAG TPA: hypothetical protein VF647_10110 [Longimicrobium sp.]|jgi:hypothetical protein